jgi:hypothetical protein
VTLDARSVFGVIGKVRAYRVGQFDFASLDHLQGREAVNILFMEPVRKRVSMRLAILCSRWSSAARCSASARTAEMASAP